MTLGFTPRTGVTVIHGSNPDDTLRLLSCLEMGDDLDLEIVIGVHEGHPDVPALADGMHGRGTLRSIDPTLSVPAGADLIIADMVGKGTQYAWILSPSVRPAPTALKFLTKHLAQVPDCAVVGSRMGRLSTGVNKSQAPKARPVDVESVPFIGSLYRVSAVATLGRFGDADIVDEHDVGWSNRARRAGWRVMMHRRAELELGGLDG